MSDLARTTVFYDASMGSLGYARVFTNGCAVGYGRRERTLFVYLSFFSPARSRHLVPGFQLAFIAPNRDAVDRFHVAAKE